MSRRAHLVIRLLALSVIAAAAYLPRAPHSQDQDTAHAGVTAEATVQ